MSGQTRQRPPLTRAGTIQTPEQEGRHQGTAGCDHLDAARHLADSAKRLSLRAAGHGQVSVDDLLDVVAATGSLVDAMLGLDPLDAVRAAGIPVPDPVPDVDGGG